MNCYKCYRNLAVFAGSALRHAEGHRLPPDGKGRQVSGGRVQGGRYCLRQNRHTHARLSGGSGGHTLSRTPPGEMLRLAACLEEHFPHSMANAMVQTAREQRLDHEEMRSEAEYLVAHGITSKAGDKRVSIGSAHFIFEDERWAEACSRVFQYKGKCRR